MIDAAVLKSEIVNDPTGVGYQNQDGTWKSSVIIAGLLNAPGAVMVKRLIATHEALNALSPTALAKIHDTAAGAPVTAGRAEAIKLLMLLSMEGLIDVTSTAAKTMLDTLASAGVLPAVDEAALINVATSSAPGKSRAQQLWGAVGIGADDVDRARTA